MRILLAIIMAAILAIPRAGAEETGFKPDTVLDMVWFEWRYGPLPGKEHLNPLVAADRTITKALVQMKPEDIQPNWEYAVRKPWPDHLLDLLERRIAWIADLYASPEKAWQTTLDYAEKAGLSLPVGLHWRDATSDESSVAWHLLHTSVDLEVPEALYQYGMTFKHDPEGSAAAYTGLVHDAARQDHEAAILEVIDGYITGGAFPRDPKKAWYWLRRAERLGLDVAREREQLSGLLTESERDEAESWAEAPNSHY